MGARRRGREVALQVLYQLDGSMDDARRALVTYFANLATSEEGREFAEALVQKAEADRVAIDECIRRASHHWRIERMTRVDRNILRLGVAELMMESAVPKRVTLNEAVELAKRFGAEGSTAFVNGILDRIADDLGRE